MNRAESTILLQSARESLLASVRSQRLSTSQAYVSGSNVGGVFVTLWSGGQLRGCMGTFDPHLNLVATVQGVADSAARDPRFKHRPITESELPRLRIEVSILSPLRRTHDPLSLVVGEDGILIRNPHRQGCFLPHVATQMRWGPEEFLRRCCQDKAGLAPEAWKDPQTEVYLFSTEVLPEQTRQTDSPDLNGGHCG